MWILV